MRKVLIVIFGLASLGALASVQPAAAKVTCQTVCELFSTDSAGHGACTRSRQKCTGTDAQGSGAVQPIQQQKFKRQN
jgi:hypothetical protein